ncbi:hypothetical protein M419DRAFT_121023, partial [Trichoderma reesei RUT C-30]
KTKTRDNETKVKPTAKKRRQDYFAASLFLSSLFFPLLPHESLLAIAMALYQLFMRLFPISSLHQISTSGSVPINQSPLPS